MVVDASAWISSLIPQDVNHRVSRIWAGRWIAGGGTVVVPTIFLAEVAGAVARRTGASQLGHQVFAALRVNPAFSFVRVDDELADRAAEHAVDLPLKG